MGSVTVNTNPLKLDIRSHKKCVFFCAVAMLSSFQYGLDYALVGGFFSWVLPLHSRSISQLFSMTGFLEVFGYYDPHLKRWNIEARTCPVVQQLISSIMTVGTFVASLLVGPFSSRFGRKPGIWAAALCIYAAAGIQIGVRTKGALYFARFLMGFSIGWFITFAQLYCHEVAPAHLRGIALAMYQIFLSIGGIVGYAVDYGTRSWLNRLSYQLPLSIFFIIPTIQALLLYCAPESPRWLMVMNKQSEAEVALRKLRNSEIDELQLQAELSEIRLSTREQVHRHKKLLFLEMWCGTNLRRTLLTISVVSFHAANGSSWINIYTTYFLQVAGVDDPLAYSILVAAIGLIGVLLSLLYVRRIGRRTLMLIGTICCGICQLIPAIVWTIDPGSKSSAKVVVAFICLFELVFVAYSPYAWLLGGEYPDNQLRASTFGVATAINFLGNWAGTFSAPYFINPVSFGWGPKYGYIWFGANIICAAFAWLFLPETKDRTLEEIHEMFEARVPARNFATHVCVGAQSATTSAGEVKSTGETTHVEGIPDGSRDGRQC